MKARTVAALGKSTVQEPSCAWHEHSCLYTPCWQPSILTSPAFAAPPPAAAASAPPPCACRPPSRQSPRPAAAQEEQVGHCRTRNRDHSQSSTSAPTYSQSQAQAGRPAARRVTAEEAASPSSPDTHTIPRPTTRPLPLIAPAAAAPALPPAAPPPPSLHGLHPPSPAAPAPAPCPHSQAPLQARWQIIGIKEPQSTP